jgi:hypothetical protein
MVIVAIHGGLGNQLFQVAAALYLEAKRCGPVRMDGHFLAADGDQRRLAVTRIVCGLTESDSVLHSLARTVRWIADRSPSRRVFWDNQFVRYVRDPADGTLGALDRSVGARLIILDGYWQYGLHSETLISSMRGRLIQSFSTSSDPGVLAARAQSVESVAVHVRRGDYVHDEKTASFHGVCDLGYYERAAAHIETEVNVESYFVFSDEIGWARENLRFDRPTVYVNSDGALTDTEEFVMMSRCRHFIIANSTFSWWAARLSDAPGKRVVAPLKWFSEPKAMERGLFPPDWHRIA